jgi:nitrogen fixation protein FixH
MTSESALDSRRSLWIPWALCGIFAVFLIANGIMVYFAGESWTGLETEGAYEKGLAYNDTIAAAAAQAALGWQVDIQAGPADQGEAWVDVRLEDREGRPIVARQVWARLVRPTSEGHDRETALASLGAGHYRGVIDLPLPGQWDLRVRVEHAGGVYHTNRRVFLKPDG